MSGPWYKVVVILNDARPVNTSRQTREKALQFIRDLVEEGERFKKNGWSVNDIPKRAFIALESPSGVVVELEEIDLTTL